MNPLSKSLTPLTRRNFLSTAALGDIAVKRRLEELLQTLVAPIRERREVLAQDPDRVLDILNTGTRAARERTQATLDEVRSALGVFMLKR
jgi:tryptophanyl-tRNA synthetase